MRPTNTDELGVTLPLEESFWETINKVKGLAQKLEGFSEEQLAIFIEQLGRISVLETILKEIREITFNYNYGEAYIKGKDGKDGRDGKSVDLTIGIDEVSGKLTFKVTPTDSTVVPKSATFDLTYIISGKTKEWVNSYLSANVEAFKSTTPGAKGETGARGEQGIAGARGAKGDKGDKGDRGSQGTQGIRGKGVGQIKFLHSNHPTHSLSAGFPGATDWYGVYSSDGEHDLIGEFAVHNGKDFDKAFDEPIEFFMPLTVHAAGAFENLLVAGSLVYNGSLTGDLALQTRVTTTTSFRKGDPVYTNKTSFISSPQGEWYIEGNDSLDNVFIGLAASNDGQRLYIISDGLLRNVPRPDDDEFNIGDVIGVEGSKWIKLTNAVDPDDKLNYVGIVLGKHPIDPSGYAYDIIVDNRALRAVRQELSIQSLHHSVWRTSVRIDKLRTTTQDIALDTLSGVGIQLDVETDLRLGDLVIDTEGGIAKVVEADLTANTATIDVLSNAVQKKNTFNNGKTEEFSSEGTYSSFVISDSTDDKNIKIIVTRNDNETDRTDHIDKEPNSELKAYLTKDKINNDVAFLDEILTKRGLLDSDKVYHEDELPNLELEDTTQDVINEAIDDILDKDGIFTLLDVTDVVEEVSIEKEDKTLKLKVKHSDKEVDPNGHTTTKTAIPLEDNGTFEGTTQTWNDDGNDGLLSREQGRAIVTNARRIAELQGVGGALPYKDFGTFTPTQEALTRYASEAIWGEGGVWTWNSANPPQSTYVINNITHKAEEIFNSTWVRNSYQNDVANPTSTINHRWVLVNTQDTNPTVFVWEDVGTDNVAIASESLAGIVKASSEIGVNASTGALYIKDITTDATVDDTAFTNTSISFFDLLKKIWRSITGLRARTITAGTGLTGGGNLSADRTIGIANITTDDEADNTAFTDETLTFSNFLPKVWRGITGVRRIGEDHEGRVAALEQTQQNQLLSEEPAIEKIRFTPTGADSTNAFVVEIGGYTVIFEYQFNYQYQSPFSAQQIYHIYKGVEKVKTGELSAVSGGRMPIEVTEFKVLREDRLLFITTNNNGTSMYFTLYAFDPLALNAFTVLAYTTISVGGYDAVKNSYYNDENNTLIVVPHYSQPELWKVNVNLENNTLTTTQLWTSSQPQYPLVYINPKTRIVAIFFRNTTTGKQFTFTADWQSVETTEDVELNVTLTETWSNNLIQDGEVNFGYIEEGGSIQITKWFTLFKYGNIYKFAYRTYTLLNATVYRYHQYSIKYLRGGYTSPINKNLSLSMLSTVSDRILTGFNMNVTYTSSAPRFSYVLCAANDVDVRNRGGYINGQWVASGGASGSDDDVATTLALLVPTGATWMFSGANGSKSTITSVEF